MYRQLPFTLSICAAWLLFAVVEGGELRLIAWNVESGGADPETVSADITDLDGYDVWGLSEVHDDDAALYAEAAAEGEWSGVEYVLGTTGGSDRLLIMWNPAKVQFIEAWELMEFRAQTGRAPLVVKLKELPDGPEFWFMNNHLHRGSAEKRMEQTLGVRGWMSDQILPVFAMGDWNYDFAIPDGPGNAAFQAMSQAVDLQWIRPPELVRTQSSFNSVLDMLWVNQEALTWNPRSKIIQKATDFQPVEDRSDHRPVDARFNTSSPFEGAMFAARPIAIREVFARPTVSVSPPDNRTRPQRAGAPRADFGARSEAGSQRMDPFRDSRTSPPVRPARLEPRGPASADGDILRQLEALRRQIDALERMVRSGRR
jgi:hypothetical protein